MDEAFLDRVRAYQQTEPYQKAIRKRSVWVEPLFAEAKDWHGLRRFRLRRLWRVNCVALLTAAGQNLKRLLSQRGWGRRPLPSGAALHFLAVRWMLWIWSASENLGNLTSPEPTDGLLLCHNKQTINNQRHRGFSTS